MQPQINVQKFKPNTTKNSPLGPHGLFAKEQIITPQEIQLKIQNSIAQANLQLKDIIVNKSSGLLNQQFKDSLKHKITLNFHYLKKLQMLAKNPFLHNDFIYNRVLTSNIHYYERFLSRQQPLEDKTDWVEAEYYIWLTALLKQLQKFGIGSVVYMRSEIANVLNWYNQFVKYVEGMRILKYPSFYNKNRKKSSEIKELERLSSQIQTYNSRDPDESGTQVNVDSNIVGSLKLKEQQTEPLSANPIFQLSNKKSSNKVEGGDTSISVLKLDTQKKRKESDIHDKLISQEFSEPFRKSIMKQRQTNLDLISNIREGAERMLPKVVSRKRRSDNDVVMMSLSNSKRAASQESQIKKEQDEEEGVKIKLKQQNSLESFNVSSSVKDSVSLRESVISNKNKIDQRRKYMMKAPLTFKMNPPPKIIDLTSDFFEKENTSSKLIQKARRVVQNNPRMNQIMIDVGKKKIEQLKNFHGKMISQKLMRDFELMFAPLDEAQDAQDYWDNKLPSPSLMQSGGILPPTLVPDEMLSNVARLSGQDKGLPDFQTTGLSIIKRTAQDDYKFSQMNEITDLKKFLVKDGIHLDYNLLQRAILIPEDTIVDNENRRFPNPGVGLMINPFPNSKNQRKKTAAPLKKRRGILNRSVNF